MQTSSGTYSRQGRIAFRPITGFSPGAEARTPGSYAIDLFCLALPLANFTSITLIGALPGGEVMTLLVVLPCLLVAWKRIWRGYSKTIFTLMGLWLLSQVVTDFYRHTDFGLAARGFAAIVFFAIDLSVVSALAYKNTRRIILLIIGQILGNALAFYFFNRFWLDEAGAWKFGYSTFVIPTILLTSSYFYAKRQYGIAFLLMIGIAGVNLSQNFRSQTLIIMASSVLILPLSAFARRRNGPSLYMRSAPRPSARRLRPKFPMHVVVLLALVGVVAFATTKTYSYLASHGALGDRALEKYEEQSRGKFGMLVGGRPETLISWRAVVDSPILGHGSWAADRKYNLMLADIEDAAGYTDDEAPAEQKDQFIGDLIPCHSYLMEAWVWAGFLGAVFWIYIFYLNGKALLRVVTVQPPLSPYLAYIVLLEFWSILFSPFGYTVRMDQSIILVIFFTLLETSARPAKVQVQQPQAQPWRFAGPGRTNPHLAR
ncbi:MAG TPA: hypothetical protein VM554_04815 [Acidisarcina sp.]|nr:hypothetical protein [Acidisarcina sp.]